MARPRSDDKRDAIMAAATKVLAARGLAAPTAMIAKAAGVANGSLFTYFPTKTDLFSDLYIELKTEMAASAMDGMPTGESLRAQLQHMWSGWVRWATSDPDKRRVLAQLIVSDEITPEARQVGHQIMAGVAALMDRSRENGSLRAEPLAFVVGLISAMTEAAIDYMISSPASADRHSAAAFDALWRVVG